MARTKQFRIVGHNGLWYIEQRNYGVLWDTWTRHNVSHYTIAQAKKSIEELGGYLV